MSHHLTQRPSSSQSNFAFSYFKTLSNGPPPAPGDNRIKLILCGN